MESYMHKELFDELVKIIERLRSDNGCPWDREQTHQSLRSDLIEEAYELIEAIDSQDDTKLCDETGDLLIQVLMHSQIAKERGKFEVSEVIKRTKEKLVRRHPHVFGELQVSGKKEVLSNWERIKSEELKAERQSVMDGIPSALPSLIMAKKIQSKASRVGFDWKSAKEVLPKLQEELDELKSVIDKSDRDQVEAEIGDLLFSIVNLCRFLDVDAEDALRRSNAKFIKRFKIIEARINSQGKNFVDYTLEELDQIWEETKNEGN